MSEKIKILMIDDEIELCQFCKINLEETGRFEVSITAKSKKAVVICKNKMPDLILLDIVMPGCSGPEVIKAIKDEKSTENIPIIVVSGLGEMVYIKKNNSWKWFSNTDVVRHRGDVLKEKSPEIASEAYGVDNFIAKPFSSDDLIKIIDETMTKIKPKKNKEDQE